MDLTPQKMLKSLVEKLNNGDIDGALAHYESTAALVEESGKVIYGTQAIRNFFSYFVSRQAQLTLLTTETIVTDDIGCNYARWKITGIQLNGESFSNEGTAIDIIRRQPNGEWKIAIDNAHGPAILK